MKHLPKNKNIYVYHNNKIYIDFFKNGKRVRKSTGLKHSALSFDFVRKHYEEFLSLYELETKNKIEAKLKLNALHKEYYKIEDKEVERKLLVESGVALENLEPKEEYSFIKVSEALLKEKSFLKGNTYITYQSLQKTILSFLNKNKLYYLSDFKREHSLLFFRFLEERMLGVNANYFHFYLLENQPYKH